MLPVALAMHALQIFFAVMLANLLRAMQTCTMCVAHTLYEGTKGCCCSQTCLYISGSAGQQRTEAGNRCKMARLLNQRVTDEQSSPAEVMVHVCHCTAQYMLCSRRTAQYCFRGFCNCPCCIARPGSLMSLCLSSPSMFIPCQFHVFLRLVDVGSVSSAA